MTINRREFARLTGGLVLGGLMARSSPGLAGESSNYVIAHGHAPFYAAHLYPGSPLTLSEQALREAGQNVLALTFDDGPNPANDTEILRLLAEYNAVATFFVIGNKVARHVDLLKQMLKAGCEIGNHSWQHPMMATLSAEAQLAELHQTDELLTGNGIPVKWFRPPYGSYDTLTQTIAQTEALETILWSVDSQDWKGSPPDEIAARVIANLSPGAVVLMHSIKSHTVTALPKILAYAKANNYRFVTLSEWKQVMIEVNPIAVRLAAERAERKAEDHKAPESNPAKLAEAPHGAEPAKATR
jgi:peptidoglycan/xylan/chitin deacetylase (PgdA/CDA1 family)